MLKNLIKIILLSLFLPVYCFGQVTDPGPGYQTIMMNNPALSGVEGDGIMRMSYLNLYPGNNYNLHSVYFSYDSYFPVLHGGAGFYITDDYQGGVINDLKGGLSYSYFLQAGRDLYINAGLSASIYHRGYTFDRAILPDQIDPMGGVSGTSSETLSNSGKSIFDIGTGFLFLSGWFLGGFSINHLTEPDLSGTGFSNEKLKREFFLHLSGDFDISKNHNFRVRPVGFFVVRRSFLAGGAGAVFESSFLSVNATLLGDNGKNVNIQTGFSIKSGKMSLYYNYKFNIVSENKLIPFSLLHETGLAFSLNSVDKKNIIKTIKFPKL